MKRTCAVVALCMLLAGCSTAIPGEPVADPSALKLDTGNYATTPRTVAAIAAADAWQQEGFNMAEAVVAPFDIRPTLTVQSTAIETFSTSIIHPVQMVDFRDERKSDGFLTRDQTLKLLGTSFQTGFLAEAADNATDPAVHLRSGLLRFQDSDAAARALQIMRDSAAETPAEIAKVRGAAVVANYPTFGRTRLAAAAQVGNLIAVSSATTRAATDAPELVSSILEAQVTKATTYRQGAPLGQYRLIPMDKDGIMSRTLPSSVEAEPSVLGLSSRVHFADGYRSTRTHYMMTLDRDWYDKATRNGIDLVAWTSESVVYRVRDRASAYAFANSSPDGVTTTSAPPESGDNRIPGLPRNANVCVHTTTSTGCTAIVGRYLVNSVHKTLQQARQATAALYMINKAAGEN
ncbi:DUF7373 family lipoprotein [Tsukamurella spumae]|uniref:Lipoprotein n=1 Tax=Tsukamurella spumae TaxID=44753 RepID=A0A846WX79_9ACTN|nr:hypothetical protein [Tsukamurella spumae]NKY17474.1 hypothetical protein [Tsukamurella spumae]